MAVINMKLALAKNRMRDRRIIHKVKDFAKKGTVTAALIGATFILTGAYSGNQKLIETTYTVQDGDTLWNISETFMKKNTGGTRYILEFMEGVKELNPELVKSKGEIYPGQVLRINYWVKEGD